MFDVSANVTNSQANGAVVPTCASQCRRHPVALICVLPFTVTSSFHGLAWAAKGLAVSPSRVQ